MRRTLLMLTILLFSGLSFRAQHILDRAHNGIRDNDRLNKIQIPYIHPGERGVGIIWRYAPIQETSKEYLQTFSADGDSIVCTEHNTLYFYRMKGDSLMLTGFENRTTLMGYNHPPCQLRFPFMYGDSITTSYSGSGIYGDRLHIGVCGYCNVVADGEGVLTDGTDTVLHVLRIHRHTEFLRKMHIDKDSVTAFLSGSDSMHITQADNVAERIAEDVYQWYQYGSRYPVMETVENRIERDGYQELRFAVSFLYPPSEQSVDLTTDNNNEQRRLQEELRAKENEMAEESTFPVEVEATVSEDGRSLHLRYSVLSDGDLLFTLYDASSRLLGGISHTYCHAGIYDEQIVFNAIPVGNVLLLHVQSGEEREIIKITMN